MYCILSIVMPALQGEENNLQFSRYSHIGNSASEIIFTFIRHPIDTLTIFFTNTTNPPFYNGIKAEFFTLWLVSGGVLLLLRPGYLLMCLPLFAVKMLSNDYGVWGINNQYSIEFIPLLSLATLSFISWIKKFQFPLIVLLIITTSYFTFSSMNEEVRVSKWYTPKNTKFYDKIHYQADLDIKETQRLLATVPDIVPLSTSARLSPHLANRRKLYGFPIVKDAEYIVLDKTLGYTYPITEELFLETLANYKEDKDWLVLQESKDMIILKRKK